MAGWAVVGVVLVSVTVGTSGGAAPSQIPGVSVDIRTLSELAAVEEMGTVDLSEADLDHVLHLRAWYGLNTDAAYVRSLYEDPRPGEVYRSSTGLGGSIRFSQDEADHLLQRARAEWVGYELSVSMPDSLAETYVATYVKETAVRVLCSGCDEPAASSTAQSVATPYDIEVLIVQVPQSYSELHAAGVEAVGTLAAEGIEASYSLDLIEGVVQLHVDNPRRAREVIEDTDSFAIDLTREVDPDDVLKSDEILYALVTPRGAAARDNCRAEEPGKYGCRYDYYRRCPQQLGPSSLDL